MQENDKYGELRADRAYMATSILIGGFLGQYHFENRSKNKTEILEISYFLPKRNINKMTQKGQFWTF